MRKHKKGWEEVNSEELSRGSVSHESTPTSMLLKHSRRVLLLTIKSLPWTQSRSFFPLSTKDTTRNSGFSNAEILWQWGQNHCNLSKLPRRDGRWQSWQIVAWLKLWAAFFCLVARNMVFARNDVFHLIHFAIKTLTYAQDLEQPFVLYPMCLEYNGLLEAQVKIGEVWLLKHCWRGHTCTLA